MPEVAAYIAGLVDGEGTDSERNWHFNDTSS
jgi:hypothetical protein